jgi:hypothetical protein
MRKVFKALLLGITLFSLFGCSSKEEAIHQEMEAFVKEYKSTLYRVDDPINPPTSLEIAESAEPYLTKDEFKSLMANRVFELPSKTAKSLNKQIALEDVILNQVTFNDDGGAWDCEVTLKIKLFNQQSSEIIVKKGQLSIMRNSNNELVIIRDWEERVKVQNELL